MATTMTNHPNRSRRQNRPILAAFGGLHLLDNFDPAIHRIEIVCGDRHVGFITGGHDGWKEMLDLSSKMANSQDRIGAVHQDPEKMRGLIVSAVFGGDAAKMAACQVRLVPHTPRLRAVR